MNVQCPYCGQHYEVDDSMLGSVVNCEVCNKAFIVQKTDKADLHESGKESTEGVASAGSHNPTSPKSKLIFFGAIVGIAAIVFFSYHNFFSDEAKIKTAVHKWIKYNTDFNLSELIKLISKDYIIIEEKIVDYDKLKLSLIALDGEHPMEWLRFKAWQENKWRPLSKEQEREIAKISKDPEILHEYRHDCYEKKDSAIKEFEVFLRSPKINIEINGNSATVTCESSGADKETNVRNPKKFLLRLRKSDGDWKICEIKKDRL